MRGRISVTVSLLGSIAAATLASSGEAGEWLSPAWADEPQFPPGSLFWHTDGFGIGPTVYRTEIVVLESHPRWAALRVRARSYVYVYLNGHRLVAAAQDGLVPGNAVDAAITEHLAPGPVAVCVSAPPEGMSFELAALSTNGRVVSLCSSSEQWRVRKFEPLTVLARQPWMQPGFDTSEWEKVQASGGPASELTPEEVARIVAPAALSRRQAALAEAQWRLSMLQTKGIALDDWRPVGWAGVERLPSEFRDACAVLAGALDTEAQRQSPEGDLGSDDLQQVASLCDSAEAVGASVDLLGKWVMLGDETTNAELQAAALGYLGQDASAERLRNLAQRVRRFVDSIGPTEIASAPAARMEAALRELRATCDAEGANRPNTCVANPLGWFDGDDVMDGSLTEWGLRAGPVVVSWKMDLCGKWRFKTDPDNKGLDEARHTLGYNIENQWPELMAPGSWEEQGVTDPNPNAVAQSPFPGVNEGTDGPYNGWAWYRRTLRVPQAWAGHDLELYVSVIDDWDWAYFNGEEIGHTDANDEGWWHIERRYHVPKEIVRFGGTNVIAFRIYDCRGTLAFGRVELRCPGLEAELSPGEEAGQESAEVLSSPLSPASRLTARGKAITLSGWASRGAAGPQAMWMPRDKVARWPIRAGGTCYDAADEDLRLRENWCLLEMGGEAPLLIVFGGRPLTILATEETLRIEFEQPGARMLMMRPFGPGAIPEFTLDGERLETCRFWSRALCAYPVVFSEYACAGRARAIVGPFPRDIEWLDVVDVYGYEMLNDPWGTEPLELAPLPPLAVLAHESKYPYFLIQSKVERVGPELPGYGVLRAARGDLVHYLVPLQGEPLRRIPRFAGFTSFCFSPADVGVPGNIKELELIADTGANSYRPQHNQNGEAAKRLLDWCVERGLNHCFNIDNALGNSPEVYEHYRVLAEMCKDLPPEAVCYDLINEPANMPPEVYNPVIAKLIETIRAVDKTHPVYIETPHSFAAVGQFASLEPTDDPLAVYCFHDYEFRLPERWPNEQTDIRDIYRKFLPAFRYGVEHHAPIAISEFGGFEQTQYDPYTNWSAVSLLNDFFRIFDQFGMHHHYYANRGIVRVLADGSIEESLVQEAYRRYFAGGTFHPSRVPGAR